MTLEESWYRFLTNMEKSQNKLDKTMNLQSKQRRNNKVSVTLSMKYFERESWKLIDVKSHYNPWKL